MDRKNVVLGTFADSRKIGKYHSRLTVTAEIEISAKMTSNAGKQRLSICGTVGYTGARDVESAGQILDDVRRLLEDPSATLNKPREQIARLLEIWERWHLNDMRPGCEHQRASWDPAEEIHLVKYKLRTEVLVKRHALTRATTERLEDGATVAYTAEERRLARLPYEVIRDAHDLAPSIDEYEPAGSETKRAGWVKPAEHPRGLLCKPCPTCGYKYGSAWLYEPLPADVVTFLENF